jgi:hypothetical protein
MPTQRRRDNRFLGGLLPLKFSHHQTFAHDEDTIAQPHDLREIARDD